MLREGPKVNNKMQPLLLKNSTLIRDSGWDTGATTVPPGASISPYVNRKLAVHTG